MAVNIATRIKYSPLVYRLKMQQKGMQIKEAIESFVPDGKPLTKLQQDAAINIHIRRFNKILKDIYNFFGSDETPLSEFDRKILFDFNQIMQKRNLNKRLLEPIKYIKTEGELNAYIMNFMKYIGKVEVGPIYKETIQHKKGRCFPLEYEQLFYKKKCFAADCIATLLRMFAKPSDSSKVIEIEKILKEQYGIQAYLNNDYERAVNILNSVKKLKENNIPIPKEYIVSDFLLGGRALFTDQHTVLLSSTRTNDLSKMFEQTMQTQQMYQKEQILLDEWQKQCGFSGWTPFEADGFVETHEACHFLHLPFLAFLQQKTGKIFADTVKKISGYAAFRNDSHYEIFAELKAKSLYEPLNSKEQHLLDILEGKR